MKKIMLIALSVLLSSGPLMAESMEQLRKSSENIRVETGDLKQKAATKQYEIAPTPVLVQLIINFFKLLFSPNGDIEISNPLTEVPQVEGTLEDDQSEEQYTEGYNYTPVDPADLKEDPPAQQPQQPQVQRPAPGGASGVIPEDLKRKALEYFSANQDKIKNKNYIGIVDFTAHSSRRGSSS